MSLSICLWSWSWVIYARAIFNCPQNIERIWQGITSCLHPSCIVNSFIIWIQNMFKLWAITVVTLTSTQHFIECFTVYSILVANSNSRKCNLMKKMTGLVVVLCKVFSHCTLTFDLYENVIDVVVGYCRKLLITSNNVHAVAANPRRNIRNQSVFLILDFPCIPAFERPLILVSWQNLLNMFLFDFNMITAVKIKMLSCSIRSHNCLVIFYFLNETPSKSFLIG